MADDLNINITGNASGLDGASKKAKGSLEGVAGSAKSIEAAFKVVKTAIDPTFAALDRYNKAQAANAALLKAGVIDANAYANAQVKLREAYDANVAAIHRRSEAGKAEAAETKRQNAEILAAQRTKAAEEKKLAAEVKAAKAAAAKEIAAAEKLAQRQSRDEAREAAAEAKRLSREQAQQERTDRRAEAEAAKQAAREKKAAARDAAAAAKQHARDVKNTAREEARAHREAADAIAQKARAERQAANAVTELRASINPAFAAQQRYNQTMQTATQLLMQNKLKTGEWISIQRQAKAQMDLNVRSLGRQNAMYVQLGYQAQDVTASLASGINPLVILAQQGGQTAAAMSTMGGKMGAVAAFLAGPWGAAIIGATLLIGYLMQSSKDQEKATLDLMDAESRRAEKLPELTKALEDFAKAQEEANRSEEASLELKARMAAEQTDTTETQLAAARQKLKDIEATAGMINSMGTSDAGQIAAKLAAWAAYSFAVQRAKSNVELLERQLRAVGRIDVNTGIEQAILSAEAATDAMAALDQEKGRTQDRINAEYSRQLGLVNKIQNADQRAAALALLKKNLLIVETNLLTEYARRQQIINDLKKEQRKTEDTIFRTREKAIGLAGKELEKQGFDVGENYQFGPRTGGHKNNEEHYRFKIDVGIPGYGPNNPEAGDAAARERMTTMVKSYQARGFRVLWNGKIYEPGSNGAIYDIKPGDNQHRTHADIGAPESIVGKPSGSALANSLVQEMEEIRREQARIAEEARKDAHESALADLDFKITLAGEDLAAVAELQKQKIALIVKFHGESSKEAIRGSRELILINRRQEQEILADTKASLDRQLTAAQNTEQARKALKDIDRDIRGDNIDTAAAMGGINEKQQRALKAELLNQMYADQEAHEKAMLDLKVNSMKATLALANLPLAEARRINTEILALQAQHLNSQLQLRRNHERDIARIKNEAMIADSAKRREMAATIAGSLRQSFQGFWMHTLTMKQALINLADSIVFKFADMGAKVLEDWIFRQLGMGKATQAAESIITGAKVAGEATRKSVGATGAIAEIGTRGATAAAGAYSSTVVIPFIGPVAAPVAAALALAAVLGFAALVSARGGQERVPMDGQITELHKDEMVLPAWMANPFRESLKNPAARGASIIGGTQVAGADARAATHSNSSSTTFNYQPNHNNMGASFDTLLKRDGASLRKWLRNEARNGNLRLG